MSCRVQIESKSIAIDDPLTAWLVIEMCKSWIPGMPNAYEQLKPTEITNMTAKQANKHLPLGALQYVEWAHWSLNFHLAGWHRTQFERARDFIREVSQSSHAIEITYP